MKIVFFYIAKYYLIVKKKVMMEFKVNKWNCNNYVDEVIKFRKIDSVGFFFCVDIIFVMYVLF